jgi:DNA-directed RNA polymerase specialized sigma24 family protein
VDKKQARAFEGFVAASGDTLLRIATLLTCDRHLAEDVYQETLQRLAARWSRIDNPMAFCRRVMHNIVIDQGRARSRRPAELLATASTTLTCRSPGTRPGRPRTPIAASCELIDPKGPGAKRRAPSGWVLVLPGRQHDGGRSARGGAVVRA